MKQQLHISVAAMVLFLLVADAARAHDTWLRANTNVVRVGDMVFLDLMLGNHGNNHRDFKIAGKASLEHSTWQVIDPDGQTYDLKSAAADEGYAPKEGFWAAAFQPAKAGLYLVAQSSDQVVSYAPKRSIHSAKTFFLASAKLDEAPVDSAGYGRVLGHPLELVPQTHPVTPMGPGTEFTVQLLYKGKPLAGAVVSFIPRGRALSKEFDATYERKTDQKGCASFEPEEANYYLIVAHVEDENDKGEGYDSTKYGATLTLYVPAICPCCGE